MWGLVLCGDTMWEDDDDNDITDFCESCGKSLLRCKCDISDDEEDTMFNPSTEEERDDFSNFSSM